MNITRLPSLLILAIIGIAFSYSPAFGDATASASFADIHKVLLQAVGDQDATPTVAQQTELLNKALKMLSEIPRGGYHGQLKGAKQSIETALSELSTGDTLHAKNDILSADDAIKSLM